jgi:hypothetical protein
VELSALQEYGRSAMKTEMGDFEPANRITGELAPATFEYVKLHE